MRTMPSTTRLHQEALEFRLMLALTYPFCLAAAAAARLAPRAPLSPPRRTVFAEARAWAVEATAHAFQG